MATPSGGPGPSSADPTQSDGPTPSKVPRMQIKEEPKEETDEEPQQETTIDPNEDLREVLNRNRANKILTGFQINHITLKDNTSDKVLWVCNMDVSNPIGIHPVHLPKTVFERGLLKCEINFSSVNIIKHLRLVHYLFFKDHIIEDWKAEYGYVNPLSINNWQFTFKAAPDAFYMPLELLSGHIVIDTYFYDGDLLITVSKMRVYYD